MEHLVTPGWLAAEIGAPDLVVLDCSVRSDIAPDGTAVNTSARPDFDAGHIPTAAFADLTGALSDPRAPIEFAVPAPEGFCAVMGALGVGDGTRVVLYDSGFSAWAARVWWMLRWVGFDDAALLDGGYAAWTGEGRPVSTDAPDYPLRSLTLRLRPEVIADKAEVTAAIGTPEVVLLDTMPAPIYRGEAAMYARPGHIRSALNIDGTEVIDASGRHKPLSEIEPEYSLPRSTRVITYCGGGILASLSAFAMVRMGFEDVAVYTASLQEWASDPDCAMETV